MFSANKWPWNCRSVGLSGAWIEMHEADSKMIKKRRKLNLFFILILIQSEIPALGNKPLNILLNMASHNVSFISASRPQFTLSISVCENNRSNDDRRLKQRVGSVPILCVNITIDTMLFLFLFIFKKNCCCFVVVCPFVGPLIPLFWTSGEDSSGFQRQSGQPYSHLAEVYV